MSKSNCETSCVGIFIIDWNFLQFYCIGPVFDLQIYEFMSDALKRLTRFWADEFKPFEFACNHSNMHSKSHCHLKICFNLNLVYVARHFWMSTSVLHFIFHAGHNNIYAKFTTKFLFRLRIIIANYSVAVFLWMISAHTQHLFVHLRIKRDFWDYFSWS